MIRFINIDVNRETNEIHGGNVFNGNPPYIHWFKGTQSTNLIYIQHICLVSDDESSLKFNIDENSIFKIIDADKLCKTSSNTTLNDIQYKDLNAKDVQVNEITLKGIQADNSSNYFYMLYILAQAEVPGQYTIPVYINNSKESYITIGADFYTENESLTTNLNNRGTNIPPSIQQAFYTSNIHEEKKDNILLNRKWKELLSNFWDIVDNKGSYKSLINSLNWFEYGDAIRLKELWRYYIDNIERYEVEEIKTELSDKYLNSLNGFYKTTYYSLTMAMQQIVKDDNNEPIYDDELNPVLEAISSRWSKQDLMLKLSLLGKYYETYFMPIHLDLIHSTIEDVVYSNSIKGIFLPKLDRNDYIYNTEPIKCNIKDGDEFILGPVHALVGPTTYFRQENILNGNNIIDYNNIIIAGVSHEVNDMTKSDKDMSRLWSQHYLDNGVIIDFEIQLPYFDGTNDFIKYALVAFDEDLDASHSQLLDFYSEKLKDVNKYNLLVKNNGYYMDYWNYVKCYDKINIEKGENGWSKPINFSLLYKTEGTWDMRFEFHTGSGYVYTHRVTIQINCPLSNYLKIYKIHPKHNDSFTFKDLQTPSLLNTLSLYFKDKGIMYQNIPVGSSIKLNNLIIATEENPSLYNDYFMFKRNKYFVYISKHFEQQPPTNITGLYRMDDIFIPEFHELEEFVGGNTLNDYIIRKNEAYCIKPFIPYGKHIEKCQWVFENQTTGEIFELPIATAETYFAVNPNQELSSGYYNIKFNYKLVENSKESKITMDSAFILA